MFYLNVSLFKQMVDGRACFDAFYEQTILQDDVDYNKDETFNTYSHCRCKQKIKKLNCY